MKKIKILKENDLSKVHEIEKECFKNNWEKKVFKDEYNKKETTFYGLYLNSELTGFMILRMYSTLVHMINFAIKQKYQNKGNGKLFLKEIHKILKKNNKKYVILEVKVSNEIAVDLYERFGYKINKKLVNYYGNTNEDAYFMIKNLDKNINNDIFL